MIRTLRHRLGRSAEALTLFGVWVAIYLIAAGCKVQGEGDASPYQIILAAIVALIIVTLAIVIVSSLVLFRVKSPVFKGIYFGLLLAIVIVLSVPAELQIAIIGGTLGISLDKLASPSANELPATVVDRLADSINKTSGSIKSASSAAGQDVRIRDVRLTLWTLVLTILVFLLAGRIAGSIGISGRTVLNALASLQGA